MATSQIEINESSTPTGCIELILPPVGGVGGNPPRNRTKKIKHSKIDKKALWDSFDLVQEEYETKDNAPTQEVISVECVFRATGERELCDC